MIERIFILHHTHVDLGYTDRRDVVCRALVDMVDQVIDLVNASMTRPPDEQFRWVHEVSWPVIQYLRRADARAQALFEQMRSGHVELTALYVNPTDLFDLDTFRHTTDLAVSLARTNELPLSAAMFSDVPGIAWSLPDLLAERDIRYLSAAPDFIMSLPLEVERPFYWEGPKGGRVLTWFTDWRLPWYAEGLHLGLTGDPAEATRSVLEYCQRLEAEGYRWSGLALHVAMDNVPPAPQLMDFVAHFNAQAKGVRAQMATNRDFFQFMESQHGTQFAVHRGAWPDWWASGNASAAYETGCSRLAKAALRRSCSIAAMTGMQPEPNALAQTIDSLTLFDEHTWGHSTSVSDPWGLDARLGWAAKRADALAALEAANRIEQSLASQFRRDGLLVAVNPFDEVWTGPLIVPADRLRSSTPDLVNESTGERVIGQRCVRRKRARYDICYVVTLPPRSAHTFRTARPRRARSESSYEALESDSFRIDFDRSTGAVRSLQEKATGRPLVDAASEWTFAELIHERVRGGGREQIYDLRLGITEPASHRPRPEFVRVSAHRRKGRCRLATGPVFCSLLTSGCLPGLRFIREIRLYRALPRIDVLFWLDKQVVTDYESLYVAFPFEARSPDVWVENAGAVFRAGIDQLPGSATDWYSVGEYVAVSTPQRTVLLVPHHAPLIQIGDIHTGKWARRLSFDKGHIFSWVMNNLWFTNFPAYQEGVVEMAWSLTAYPDAFDEKKATRFARDARLGAVVV